MFSLVFHDMQYGPQAALIAESFGPGVRCRGTGLGYQLVRTAVSEFGQAVDRPIVTEAACGGTGA